VPTQIVW